MSDSTRPPDSAATSDAAPADAGGYRVRLPTFEGPLDLLLHLIQQHELDIADIPIGFITEKYVEYIKLMEVLNIDVASEYLVMAATLAHIKSKMLLPPSPDDQEQLESELDLDPRAELVRRLLEYQKYKEAAQDLGGRSVLGRDVFSRGMSEGEVEGPAPLAALSVFKLLDAFRVVLERAERNVDHEISLERFSITDRINQLADRLRERSRLTFDELFVDQRTKVELIVTFLALLEMTRLRMTRLSQEAPLAPIYIELAVVEGDANRAAEGAQAVAPSPEAKEAEMEPSNGD